jgi:hypothetical protein
MLLAAALVVLLVVLTSSGGPPPLVLPTVTGPGPESILEEETLLHTDPAGTVALLKQLGVDRVRVYVDWQRLAPAVASRMRPAGFDGADPAAYPQASWAIYDTIVREIRAHGMQLDMLLSGPAPRWATGRGEPRKGLPGVWKPSARDYGQFVRAVATRYSGTYTPPGQTTPLPRVGFWSLWNEPNLGFQLAPQATDHAIEVSPTSYRALLDAAWRALQQAGHGHDTIVIGELGPAGEVVGAGPGNFNSMAPLRFLRALYCVDSSYRPLQGLAAEQRRCPTNAAGLARFPRAHPALFHASGYSIHPYSQSLPPNVAAPDEPDFAQFAALPKLERVLDTLQRAYGSHRQFPLWSTEYGYQTSPPDPEPGSIAPALAAYYINWAEYLTWRNPRLRSYDQYLLHDSTTGYFATGLESDSGVPKPSLAAYRMPLYLPVTAASSGQRLEVWGCVRPADYARHAAGARQQVQIQFRRGSDGPFQTVRTVTITNAHGYFDIGQVFPSSGAVRTAWSYPSGQTIYSRVVNITLH